MKLRVRAVTGEEKETLQRWVGARSGSVQQRDRALIVLWSQRGWWVSDIARFVGVSEPTARLWIKRFNAEGLDGLRDQPRSGRPATYSPEQVSEVIAASLTNPLTLGLPFASWTLDRLEAYLNEQKAIAIKRSRIDELLLAEGLRWRTQETWFGERAALKDGAAAEASWATAAMTQPKERPLDPGFAPKRGSSRSSTRSHAWVA